MSDTYKYKAFISYRHQALDSMAAERLQKMLEKYKPPRKLRLEKQKMRIFRDVSELPSSENLGDDIRSALDQSEFLIVICSPDYQQSKWCMEELRYFRSLHGNSNKNIIPLLVKGEPSESFPDELCWEDVQAKDENGSSITTLVEVEPLAANITAPTERASMKRLKTEYLRILAPLLGVGFDDLYRRETRRKRAVRAAAVSAAMGVLSVITAISVVSAAAIRKKNDQIEENNSDLLKENAVHLAQESKILYQDGDLLSAIERAYSALPQDDDDEKPIVPDVLNVLSKEFKLYETENIMPQIALCHDTEVESIKYTGAGKAITSADSTGIYFWDAETGELLKKITKEDEGFISDKPLKLYYERVLGADNAPSIQKSAYDLGVNVTRNSTFNILFTNNDRDLSKDTYGEGGDVFVVNESDFTITRLDGATGETKWVNEPEELSYINAFYDDGIITRFGSKEDNGETKYYIEPIMLDSGKLAGTYEINSAICELPDADAYSLKMSLNNYGTLCIVDDEHSRYYIYSIFHESGTISEEKEISDTSPSSISISQRTFGTDYLIAATSDFLYYQITCLMLFITDDNGNTDPICYVASMNITPDSLIELYPGDKLGLDYDLLIFSDDRALYLYRYDKLEEIATYSFEADISSASLSKNGFIHVMLSDGSDYRIMLQSSNVNSANIGMHFGKALLSNGKAVYSQGKYVTCEKFSNVAYIQYRSRNKNISDEIRIDGECNYLVWAVKDNKVVFSTYTGDNLIQQVDRDDHVWIYDGSDGSIREIKELRDCYVYYASFLDDSTILVHYKGESDKNCSMITVDTDTLDIEDLDVPNNETPFKRDEMTVSGDYTYYKSKDSFLTCVDMDGNINSIVSDKYGDEIFYNFDVSPTSGRVIGSVAMDIDNDPLYKICLYDPEEGLSEIMDIEAEEVINYFWLDDDTPCFLNWDRDIYVFDDVKNGKYTKIGLDGITAPPIGACALTDKTIGVLCRNSCIYEVDADGYTGRSAELNCDVFDETGQISAYDSTSSFMLGSTPFKNDDINAVIITWDICTYDDSAFKSYMDNAWVLLPDEMKVLYYVPYYVGASESLNCIYTNDYTNDTICSYPLFSADDISSAAEEYLSALKQ